MSRHQTDPLRPLTAEERQQLTRLSRSLSAPAAQVERARALLAIADGASYTVAAHQVGTYTIGRTLHEAGLSWHRPELAEEPHLVRDGRRDAPAQAWHGHSGRS